MMHALSLQQILLYISDRCVPELALLFKPGSSESSCAASVRITCSQSNTRTTIWPSQGQDSGQCPACLHPVDGRNTGVTLRASRNHCCATRRLPEALFSIHRWSRTHFATILETSWVANVDSWPSHPLQPVPESTPLATAELPPLGVFGSHNKRLHAATT